MERSKVNKEDTWNLELVFKDINEFNDNYQKLEEMLNKEQGLIKNFLKDKKHFKEFILFDQDVSILLEKLYIYASCKNDEDKSNSFYQELNGKMDNLYAKYVQITSSLEPRLLKLNNNILKEYFNDKDLSDYDYYYERLLSRKRHTLSTKEENILSYYMIPINNNSETASLLMNVDMKFGKVKDEDGNNVELNSSNYSRFMESSNRKLREEAFKKLHATYGKYRNTLTSTYYQTVKNDIITSRIRHYKSVLDMAMSPSKLPIKMYDNLIKVAHDNLPTLYEYYNIKKDLLKVDKFHLYDGYAKVLNDNNKNYTFNEGKELVLNALSVLGEDYISNLKKAFNEKWIDIYPNDGKKSGAYSTGSYVTPPYVLLNYENKYNDVSTLAHELGHSMHTYYSNHNNSYPKSGYPIFLAEIASTTNELLLSYYMYEHAKTKNEKMLILNNRLDTFKATFFRQTMFGEFEKIVHNYVEEDNVLTADYLEKVYYNLNKKYFGKDVVIDKEISYEWSRIPHFYTPFYVYKYATSIAISTYIAKNIINRTKGFRDKYLEFLKSGGRNYPLEILKLIDIDLKDNKIFTDAVNAFKEDLELFKKISKED